MAQLDAWKKMAWFAGLCLSVFGISACFTSLSRADEQVATASTLEGLVSQWVELQAQIADEKEDWTNEKRLLEQEITLLKKEKKLLNSEMESLHRSNKMNSTERLKLLEDKKKYDLALQNCLPALEKAETCLWKWQKRLPQPLLVPLEKTFNKLRASRERSVSQRLQIILALYTQIEEYQYSINLGKQLINTPDQRTLEFNVIYIGLAQAFCVSPDGTIAGIGYPAVAGPWEWQWRNNLAMKVKKCMELKAREKIAEFVDMPILIKRDEP